MEILSAIEQLDGNYSVIYQAQVPVIHDFEWADHALADTVIKNGRLTGRDAGNCSWDATLTLNDYGGVDFTATVSAQNTAPTTFIMNAEGMPTKETQTYAGNMSVTLFEDKVRIYGTVIHGVVSIVINMKRD